MAFPMQPADSTASGPVPGLIRFLAGDRRRASISALVASIVLHATLCIVAAIWVVGGSGAGTGQGEGEPGPIEMAVVTEGELNQLQSEAVGMATPTVPDAAVQEDHVVTNIPDAGPRDAAGGEGVSELGALSGGGDISIGGGEGSGLGGSGSGGASFFGVEAQGNRFAFLVDVSGSMSGPLDNGDGSRIVALRRELSRSINGLLENSQLMVVKFSTNAETLGKREWLDASPSGKKRILPEVQALSPDGGTEPLAGFQLIFAMKPRPDAIYFMTDGQFSEDVVMAVAELNARSKIPIHCICLGGDADAVAMRQISRASKGTFHIVGGMPQKP